MLGMLVGVLAIVVIVPPELTALPAIVVTVLTFVLAVLVAAARA